jgi:hypothetical protein
MKRIKRTFTQNEKDLVFNLWKQGSECLMSLCDLVRISL